MFQREFQKEICYKREEIHNIQQRLIKAQKSLHLLKYIVVKSFYENKELKINNTNEVPVIPSCSNSATNMNEIQYIGQTRIHPAVKKLIGKRPLNYEPYRTRKKNSKITMKHGENVTIKEEPFEVNHIKTENTESEINNSYNPFMELDHKINFTEEVEDSSLPVRNRNKNKYRFIVGNISKWMPSNSALDNSTHKWMMYVRGPKENPDITPVVKKVRFFLHPSYQPNDIVDIKYVFFFFN